MASSHRGKLRKRFFQWRKNGGEGGRKRELWKRENASIYWKVRNNKGLAEKWKVERKGKRRLMMGKNGHFGIYPNHLFPTSCPLHFLSGSPKTLKCLEWYIARGWKKKPVRRGWPTRELQSNVLFLFCLSRGSLGGFNNGKNNGFRRVPNCFSSRMLWEFNLKKKKGKRNNFLRRGSKGIYLTLMRTFLAFNEKNTSILVKLIHQCFFIGTRINEFVFFF